MWNNHSLDVVCNLRTWRQNFDTVHDFYNDLRVKLGTVEPNAAHRMVRDWQTRYDTTIITQNVDDLFERAGCTDVIHLHGFLTEMECRQCHHVWDIGYTAWKIGDPCAREGCMCHRKIKPHVVFFEENAPRYKDLYETFEKIRAEDVVVVIGTSSQVVDLTGSLELLEGYKIINNLICGDPNEYNVYNKTIYKPATQGVLDIDAEIRALMK